MLGGMAASRGLPVIYLVFQAAAGVAWWSLLFVDPDYRASFAPAGADPSFIETYLIADGVFFVGASLASVVALVRRHPSASPLLWFTCGAVAYAALMTVGATIVHGSPLHGTVMMLLALAGTAWVATSAS